MNHSRNCKSLLAAALAVCLAASAAATPPPWAPAHGYRDQYRVSYDYPPPPWHDRDYRNSHLHGERYCREYTTRARVGGHRQQTYGQACLQPDGSWVMR
jgi:hypothetical protein